MRMNLPKLGFRGSVPLVNGPDKIKFNERDWIRAVERQARVLRPFEVVRPTARTKAGWIDDFLATGRNVRTCEDCTRFYRGFEERYDYIHDGYGTGSCTGCDARFVLVNKWRKRKP